MNWLEFAKRLGHRVEARCKECLINDELDEECDRVGERNRSTYLCILQEVKDMRKNIDRDFDEVMKDVRNMVSLKKKREMVKKATVKVERKVKRESEKKEKKKEKKGKKEKKKEEELWSVS